jgi:hypothetical protein
MIEAGREQTTPVFTAKTLEPEATIAKAQVERKKKQ